MTNQILKFYKRTFQLLRQGKSASNAQRALFKALEVLNEECDRRLTAEIKVIDMQAILNEQTLLFYDRFPPGDEAFEKERKFETERFKALIPIVAERKKAKVEEQNAFRVQFLKTITELSRKYPGVDMPAGGA